MGTALTVGAAPGIARAFVGALGRVGAREHGGLVRWDRVRAVLVPLFGGLFR